MNKEQQRDDEMRKEDMRKMRKEDTRKMGMTIKSAE
jgi:hypothetical protein